MAGRSGRFAKRGKVLIQTKLTHSPLLNLASEQNYKQFYQTEIAYRQQYRYPPFSKLCRLVIRSTDFQIAQKESIEIYKKIINTLKQFCEVFPPSPCILSKINKYFRWNIIIKIYNIKLFLKEFHSLKKQFNHSANHYLEIDMDPIELL